MNHNNIVPIPKPCRILVNVGRVDVPHIHVQAARAAAVNEAAHAKQNDECQIDALPQAWSERRQACVGAQ